LFSMVVYVHIYLFTLLHPVRHLRKGSVSYAAIPPNGSSVVDIEVVEEGRNCLSTKESGFTGCGAAMCI